MQKKHTDQSERVKKRKYHHRLSRKGYVGLQEEEIKEGNLERGEIPDRAVLWKKARKVQEDVEISDKDLAKVVGKIDDLIKKKEIGEFQPSGSKDVLTLALETPEHSGRVRGVGGFVTPKLFFNLPRQKRNRVSKADLSDELERQRKEIAELKAMIHASNIGSPISSKSSCQPVVEEEKKVAEPTKKPDAAKELGLNDDDDFVAIIDPPPPAKKSGQCVLAVDTIQRRVAFGIVFDDPEMNATVHGVPVPPGCMRVSVDGIIEPNAMVPIPVPGEIEKVCEAVGSQLAWPEELIIFGRASPKKKKNEEGKPKTLDSELKKLQQSFHKVKLRKKVPSKYKVLYKHASTFMKATGASVQIPCDADVFGAVKTIFVLQENLISLLEFDMIGQSVVGAYMA
ncbi:uncharacterized protein LOC135151101 [Daucus carota subsp. sativus]|uniref:uncharacterized protein LOC135151101 n=1 Tax=Daucus carota subsp. sativus TaxID=79200 RepID=UPI00308366F3